MKTLDNLTATDVETTFYHGKPSLDLRNASRPFVVWDGEGAEVNPQNYVLLGCFNGSTHERIVSERLTTLECLKFIVAQGKANQSSWHVSFAFDYDVNMILRSVSTAGLKILRRTGSLMYRGYRIQHIASKWLMVTEYGKNYANDKRDRITVTIYDTFGFFQTSLVKALKSYIPQHELMTHLPEIEAGKSRRGTFTFADIDYIERYWQIENALFHALINELRDMLYSVGLRISKWHGPGALASYTYRIKSVQKHKADCGPEIYDASRFAYAGGRFELFRVGRHVNAYGYDINSAYPHAISQLPSLSEGHWVWNDAPQRCVKFGLYHVRLKGPPVTRTPSPLFHRDRRGNVSFPWVTEGWYWSPEVNAMAQTVPHGITVMGGWEYIGWQTQPFAFVEDMYNERRIMKRDKVGAQIALKLCLNSLYGKMAQRAGWERNMKAPAWHQLEWAGWVTSYTRASLYLLMHRIPWQHLIAVETDGVYTTMPPHELGIENSVELGGWEINEYDELVYLQSGVYAKSEHGVWSSKYRGLDANSLTVEDIANHAHLLQPNAEWPPVVGTTTRFVGYKAALFREEQNRGPMKTHHCAWETDKKELTCGSAGKRVHTAKLCAACDAGLDAYEMPHDLTIRSLSLFGIKSARHDIPWLDAGKNETNEVFDWREYVQENEGLTSVVG